MHFAWESHNLNAQRKSAGMSAWLPRFLKAGLPSIAAIAAACKLNSEQMGKLQVRLNVVAGYEEQMHVHIFDLNYLS